MRGSLKKLPLLLAFLLLALRAACPDVWAAGDVEEMVAQAKLGVVQLYSVEYRNGQPTGYGSSGTGFAVGTAGEDSNVFVTNWHVVTGSGEFDPNEARVYIALDNSSFEDAVYETDRVIPCEILYITTGNPDFAILRATVSVAGFKALPLLSADQIMDAAHVVALGYPGLLDDFSATHGGINDMSTTQGYISRHAVGAEDDADLSGTKLLFFDAVISAGNSGGPLLNDDGAVVGINTYGFGEGGNYSGAIYIDYAMEALDGLGIAYTVYQPSQEEPGSASVSPLIIALAAGGAVLALVVVLVIVLRRKPVPAGVAAGGRQSGGKETYVERIQPSNSFSLQGPDGQNTPVPPAGLIIGRDPAQCTLCLPENTRGVSRLHCQVTISGIALVLTDLGSSHGTFVNGQKLAPHQPVSLSRGVSFSLGGPSGTSAVTYMVR